MGGAIEPHAYSWPGPPRHDLRLPRRALAGGVTATDVGNNDETVHPLFRIWPPGLRQTRRFFERRITVSRECGRTNSHSHALTTITHANNWRPPSWHTSEAMTASRSGFAAGRPSHRPNAATIAAFRRDSNREGQACAWDPARATRQGHRDVAGPTACPPASIRQGRADRLSAGWKCTTRATGGTDGAGCVKSTSHITAGLTVAASLVPLPVSFREPCSGCYDALRCAACRRGAGHPAWRRPPCGHAVVCWAGELGLKVHRTAGLVDWEPHLKIYMAVSRRRLGYADHMQDLASGSVVPGSVPTMAGSRLPGPRLAQSAIYFPGRPGRRTGATGAPGVPAAAQDLGKPGCTAELALVGPVGHGSVEAGVTLLAFGLPAHHGKAHRLRRTRLVKLAKCCVARNSRQARAVDGFFCRRPSEVTSSTLIAEPLPVGHHWTWMWDGQGQAYRRRGIAPGRAPLRHPRTSPAAVGIAQPARPECRLRPPDRNL